MGMVIREVYPRCQSATYKKNGHIHNGKQNHQGKDCGRQFVDCFEQYRVSNETRELIERLVLERISLRGICRAVKVGLNRIQDIFDAATTASYSSKHLVVKSGIALAIRIARYKRNSLES